MRVGLLAPPHEQESGGGYTYVNMVFAAAETFDFHAEIVDLDFRAIDYAKEDEVDKDLVPPHTFPINVKFTRSLNRRIKKLGVDLVWLVTPSTICIPCVPFVVTVWDLAHRYQPFFPEVSMTGWVWNERESYFQTILPRASFIFTGTNRGACEVKTCYGVPAERLRVIPLPAPRMKTAQAVGTRQIAKRYLFYPAQFWPHKNHVRAIEALSILRGEFGLDLELVLVGSDQGNATHIRDLVNRADLTAHVHFLGFVERSVLEALYSHAEALLYLSFLGPDNLPPLEAFALGCPVVVSDHPGHREQLGDGALFVDPLDSRAIASGVRRLLETHALREELVARGRVIAEQRSIQSYLSSVRDVFDEFAAYQACWEAPSARSPSEANVEECNG